MVWSASLCAAGAPEPEMDLESRSLSTRRARNAESRVARNIVNAVAKVVQ